MQRREAKIGLRDRKRHRRPKGRNDAGENTHRNGLFRVGPGIRGPVGLDGGGCWAQTGDPPASHRTGLRPAPGCSSRERAARGERSESGTTIRADRLHQFSPRLRLVAVRPRSQFRRTNTLQPTRPLQTASLRRGKRAGGGTPMLVRSLARAAALSCL
jgi:hypothetical protein